ncbi:PREDICTED: uncharacterized protein LOC107193868 [Dufourea novaeangliae]|uniref:uncharacterized protein LOC107193868 n=1 Tax=Dufourea novaeangliae TaxID=178035 RepID=UPI000767DB6F|nr:PREDICTED: uncharacterized protein LOC107193868 [Dufourea novaeangliae]
MSSPTGGSEMTVASGNVDTECESVNVLLEDYFKSARILKDETKFSITIANSGEKYVELVEDVILNPAEEGQFGVLKRELIKRLAESDSSRVRKLMESEKMRDRTPSQFFRDLKKLATQLTPDDFIVTLWKNRLPANTQRVLVVMTKSSITALTEMADRIHEIQPENGHIAAVTEKSELSAVASQVDALINNLRRSHSPSGQQRSQRQGTPMRRTTHSGPERRFSNSEV